MASMLNKTLNGTIVVRDYVDVTLIDTNKTSYGIVSNIYPKDPLKVIYSKKIKFTKIISSKIA
jgi:hypothetical protein